MYILCIKISISENELKNDRNFDFSNYEKKVKSIENAFNIKGNHAIVHGPGIYGSRAWVTQ